MALTQKAVIRPVPSRGEVVLYLRGGYVIKIAKEFSVPVDSYVDLELNQAESVVKDDWFFNNDEILENKVSDDGKKVGIHALSIGVCKCLIRSINLEIVITVTGQSAVGFDVSETSVIVE